MVDLEFLKKVSLFKGLNDGHLTQLLEGCQETEYKKGDRLFAEGEDARFLWIVIDGHVDIRFDLPGRDTSAESTVYTETVSKSFGWSSFVPPHKYILSAYCAGGRCRIARLSKEYLTTLFESDYGMGYILMSNLAAVISSRFHDLQMSPLGNSNELVKIKVHMATCGVAAGAREVMKTLQDEVLKTNRHDIQIESAGCLGKCSTEPNITVEIGGKDPVVYQLMDTEKTRQVFQGHIINGVIQSDFVMKQ